MDERLIPAGPGTVRRLIARTYLQGADIDPALGDIRLQPHQVDAVCRLLTLLGRDGGALLADATGLGKTFVAIAVARRYTRPLVVVPAAIRSMWHESLDRCGVAAEVRSYEALSRRTECSATRPDLLILDEAHHARNPATQRYAALANLSWGADVLLLTATPLHNRTLDVQALFALFMGSSAYELDVAELTRMIVRRTDTAASRFGAKPLPAVASPTWISIPPDRATMHAITAIPPAVPAADGAPAQALLQLGLIRAWCSSEAALRETLRRRLRRAAAFLAAIDEGRVPTRRELANWLFVDGAVQLGLPLPTAAGSLPDRGQICVAIERHASGVRTALDQLDANAGRADQARIEAFTAIAQCHNDTAVVAFTQFADTAGWMFRATTRLGAVALVSGRGARVASGPLPEDEVVPGFDVSDSRRAPALPLRVLIATDVLSEGLSLRRGGVLVHLDLPWTVARLEQRVGRLRRFGSPHRMIAVYAIGPPASARELMPALRALQRKARLSSGVVGAANLEATLPLFGERMRKAINTGRLTSATCEEELREILRRWAQCDEPSSMRGEQLPGAMALVNMGATPRLLAVTSSGVSVSACDLVAVASSLETGGSCGDDLHQLELVEAKIRRWLEEQRGRELAGVATEAASPAHAAVLSRLSQRLHQATRAERVSLGTRIGRLRELVSQARGAGAERALQVLVDRRADVDLDALEALLLSRRSRAREGGAALLLAIVAVQPDGTRVAAARGDLVPVTT